MSETKLYTFFKSGFGTLDLECDSPSKQVYKIGLPDAIPCKIDGQAPRNFDGNLSFFEWQKIRYTFIADKDCIFKPPFSFIVNNSLKKKSELRGEEIHLLSGQFSFDDQVGETLIQIIDVDNHPIFRLETEVFPQKMDYKSDYKAMMAEIAQIIQNLAYDSLKDTFRKSRAKLTGTPTQNEWWNILDVLSDQLLQSLAVIKRQPKHEIRRHELVLPVNKIKQASKNSADWFRKNIQHSTQQGFGLKISSDRVFSKALSIKKDITYDTYENRFIAWAVKKLIDQLRKYKKHIEGFQGNSSFEPLLQRINSNQRILQSILCTNPFNEVSEFEKRSHFSTSLTQGAGYRDFMHIYLLLLRGLEISNNAIFKIEQKDISTLYEYWCFLKLVQLLKEQNALDVEYQDLIKIKATKFIVTLKKGDQSKIRFKKENSEDTTTIYFNREFKRDAKRIFTFDQIPDYSIEFKKTGFDKPFWYLFDAKYRFEEKIDYEYNVPQDAIGQLHRYRDAILHTEPSTSTYRGAIKNLGGIILYPYPLTEELFKSNVYFQSINAVNIGALPFLPSKVNLVSELLKSLINKLPEEHFEQFIEMDHNEYDLARNEWRDWITIGIIRNDHIEERRKFILSTNIYHVRFVKNQSSKLYMSKSLLIYDPVLGNSTLYDIKSWEIASAKELESKGASWPLSTDKYVIFNLVKLKDIELPGKIGTINGYRYTTKAGLEKYLRSKDKRFFYLTNADSARLFKLLTAFEPDFKVNWANKIGDASLVQFEVLGKKILSSDTFPSLYYEMNDTKIHLSELLNKLKAITK